MCSIKQFGNRPFVYLTVLANVQRSHMKPKCFCTNKQVVQRTGFGNIFEPTGPQRFTNELQVPAKITAGIPPRRCTLHRSFARTVVIHPSVIRRSLQPMPDSVHHMCQFSAIRFVLVVPLKTLTQRYLFMISLQRSHQFIRDFGQIL